MTDIPPACPKCGNPEVRVQVLTWALYRDGELEGLLFDAPVEQTGEGIVRCDDEDCDWQLPEKMP